MGVIDFFNAIRKRRKRIYGNIFPLQITFYFDDMRCEACFDVPFVFNPQSKYYEGRIQLYWDRFVEANPELNKNLILRNFGYSIFGEELKGSRNGFNGINYLEPNKGIDIKLLVHIEEEQFYEFVSKVSSHDMGGSVWTELRDPDSKESDKEQ